MDIYDNIDLQENKTISNEIVSFQSNALFNPNMNFDQTLGFIAFNVFE